jgi:hypothetical protein
MIEAKQPYADLEKKSFGSLDGSNQHSIPLSQSLIQSKALTLLNSTKAEGSLKSAEVSLGDLRKAAGSIA